MARPERIKFKGRILFLTEDLALLKKQLDGALLDYADKERAWETALRGVDVELVEVGPEFFGVALAEWEAIWSKKASTLSMLKAEAAANANKAIPP